AGVTGRVSRAPAGAAGPAEIGAVTLAERPTRMAFAASGLLVASMGELFSASVSRGAATLATTVWLLVGLIGLGQLLVAVVRTLGRGAAPGDPVDTAPTEDLAAREERTVPLYPDPPA
ncbi:MAG TPA: hypothetical protein VJT31_18260, partial [Rugosimonospora sp.]|nr:hypothetical protein [Rugosimonospora sp.]